MRGEVADEWVVILTELRKFANGSFSFSRYAGIIFREKKNFRTFFRMRRGGGAQTARWRRV
jgi:hypothetical protein